MKITQEKYAVFDRKFLPLPMVVYDFIQGFTPDADSKKVNGIMCQGKNLSKSVGNGMIRWIVRSVTERYAGEEFLPIILDETAG